MPTVPLHFLFSFTLQPEIGRAFPFRYSFSGTHTRRDELRRFPLPLLLPLLRIPTLPYLTLHYSPSREVDTKVYKKGSQVPYVAQINIGRQRHIPTYLPRDIHVPIWATKNAYLGRYRYLYT